MTPDDPRHGTNGGYMAHVPDGDYCQPCKDAHAAYQRNLWRRRYLLRTDTMLVDVTGTRRRLQALQAIGWRFSDIDERCGFRAGWSKNAITRTRVRVELARKVAEVYDELSMTLGTGRSVRAWAMRKGWAPPLAWNDIDDPRERPKRGSARGRSRAEVDPIVVERLLAGDRIPNATPAEKDEAMRRWKSWGRSTGSLAAMHGWAKPERDRKDVA